MALSVTELRIRNLVLYAGLYLFVSAINRHGEIRLSSLIDEIDTDCKNCEGIPLTEERLIKFGFETEWRGNGNESKIDTFSLWKGHGWDHWAFIMGGNNDDTNDFIIELEYVHQLQNLYFALKGTELVL